MVEKPMDLLKGLDDINWSELSHAYGPATDVPENLRKLLSIDKEEWENAYGELAHSIWHQGTVYSVTEFVVPFLIV